jgi:hypothetical protein
MAILMCLSNPCLSDLSATLLYPPLLSVILHSQTLPLANCSLQLEKKQVLKTILKWFLNTNYQIRKIYLKFHTKYGISFII